MTLHSNIGSGLIFTFALAGTAPAQPVDFNAQIRPILNQNCTACHGGVKAAGDISFVYREAAAKVGKKSGRPVIVSGKPEESELIARVTSTDLSPARTPPDKGPENGVRLCFLLLGRKMGSSLVF